VISCDASGFARIDMKRPAVKVDLVGKHKLLVWEYERSGGIII
jgi:hypothetical protein